MLALSEIASDRQSDTFTVSTSYIAQRAGVTSKTVQRMIKTFKRLGFVKSQPRSANGLKLASEYSLIRGHVPMGPIYPTLGKARETRVPTREELEVESIEGTARKEKKSSLNVNGEKGDQNEDDIVDHERTGERFNKRKGEFVW
jgi:hypothetical protein